MRDSKAKPAGSATLTYKNKSYELPVFGGTVGPNVVDIRKLYGDADVFTYDPGFTSTASCESDITFIDGDKGILLYRGYPIDQLAEHSNFLEVCYLLLHGELPNKKQMDEFDHSITKHTMVHEQLATVLPRVPPRCAPDGGHVRRGGRAVGVLSRLHGHQRPAPARDRQPSPDRKDADHRGDGLQICRSASPSCIRSNNLGYTENFLRMTFSVPAEEYKVNPVLAKALDTIFILHADHEQNASTSTVRLAGSSGANPFACIAAGIACLWGPAHGGANEAALKMLEEIGTVDRIPEFIKSAKDPNDNFRLSGFGHRVYKNYDPRAKAMQIQAHAVLEEVGHARRSDAESRDGAGTHRAAGRILHREEALSEYRFLFGHHAARAGLPHEHVHRAVRARAHGRLDRAVERDDRGSAPEDRPAAPDLYWRATERDYVDLAKR